MKNNTWVRIILAAACFGFAGLKLRELLNGPGNYAWQDLSSVGIFTALGLFYLYILWKQKNQPSS
ncbi:hypothetical protein [uncultured Pontibacter sp.]|uniref:hypothetical protein n=1 Tax=uncultured Pontibacter sp. TaxID=453356 RepID=UPI00261942BD|nr:hypothetical protein [uncultured Pontibacter sp.]